MKRYLLLFLITIGSNSGLLSQNTDTLCFPVTVIRKVLIAAEQKKVADSLLSICERQVSELNSQIKLLNEKDKELKAMYDGQLENLHQQITLYKDQINGYEKLVKRERRKRRLATAGGILTTGVMAYLFLVK